MRRFRCFRRVDCKILKHLGSTLIPDERLTGFRSRLQRHDAFALIVVFFKTMPMALFFSRRTFFRFHS
jgi:hypothetical protein